MNSHILKQNFSRKEAFHAENSRDNESKRLNYKN